MVTVRKETSVMASNKRFKMLSKKIWWDIHAWIIVYHHNHHITFDIVVHESTWKGYRSLLESSIARSLMAEEREGYSEGKSKKTCIWNKRISGQRMRDRARLKESNRDNNSKQSPAWTTGCWNKRSMTAILKNNSLSSSNEDFTLYQGRTTQREGKTRRDQPKSGECQQKPIQD